MSRTGRRRNDGKSSLELRKLRAETRIAERQLDEMHLRMTCETIKVWLAVVIAFNATVGMSRTIGPSFRGGVAMWETKETLEGGLRIDRRWVVVKAGTVVAVGALVDIGIARAFL